MGMAIAKMPIMINNPIRPERELPWNCSSSFHSFHSMVKMSLTICVLLHHLQKHLFEAGLIPVHFVDLHAGSDQETNDNGCIVRVCQVDFKMAVLLDHGLHLWLGP